MTKKKAPKRASPTVAPHGLEVRPANFGLIYTLVGGQVVMGVHGLSFTIFASKRDAVDWLRALARNIEDHKGF